MKKHILPKGALILAVVMVFALAAQAAPAAAGTAQVRLGFTALRQGRVGLVYVTGEAISDVRAVFQERVFHFYPKDGRWAGFISANFSDDVGTYPMQVWVQYTDGSAETLDQPVQVTYGEFGRSDVTLPARLYPLLEPEIEAAEMEHLFNIFERFTPERYWEDGGFIPPISGEEIGWFGTWRLFNETYWRRHTGVDVRAPIGTPVQAMASGRVILVETLAIRGNYILIDHGWGIYSGYAHLSEQLVVPGQWVRQGDVIGLTGLNGRSAGAHLHYEMAAGGAWTDPLDLIALGLGVNAP